MNFYKPHTKFYCGVDLHSRNIYICVIDREQKKFVHKNLKNRETDLFLKYIEPYKNNIVVGCESSYAWYWLADLCADNNIEFILGHALYMKAIHGAKVKNDKIDSEKIAKLMQGGMFPQAYVYPQGKRSVRDLLRRRLYFVRERADMFAHIQLLNHQVNNPALGQLSKSNYKRKNLKSRFNDTHILKSLDANMQLLEKYDEIIRELEVYILQHTRKEYRQELSIIQSIHGIGEIISLTILYEIDSIDRFSRIQDFVSYSRLIKCPHESGGKKYSGSNGKIGNPHLKRAFSSAATYVIKFNPEIRKRFDKLSRQKGQKLAYGIIARQVAETIFHLLKTKKVFDMKKFLSN
jgi:transposase